MRWLFLLLLAVNIGILVWNLQQQSDFEPQLTQEAGVGNLRLLTQRDKALTAVLASPDNGIDEREPALPETQESRPAAANTAAGQAARDVAPNDAERPSIESTLAAGPVVERREMFSDIEAPPPGQPVEDTANESPVSQGIESLPGDLPTDAPVAAAGQADESGLTLQRQAPATEALAAVRAPGLENESETLPSPGEPAAIAANSPKVEVAAPVEICGVLGPVEDDALARSLLNALEDKGLDAALRRETRQKTQGYWVMLPPRANRREAIEVVRRLRAEGITDVMRFYQGEMRNAVSLGMYSRRRNADNRRQRIAEKGFDAEVRARTREVQVHLIDYRGEAGLIDRALRGVQQEYPDIEHNGQTCPQIVRP